MLSCCYLLLLDEYGAAFIDLTEDDVKVICKKIGPPKR